ncbi:MAG: YfcE family phosphodiesterase [Bacilli bacterium]|nr:YfcE family phosphodiesterase [Bacilli bacterium]
MKILIISDIHDDFDSLKIALQNHSFDKLILLGDLGYYNDKVFDILNIFKDQIISVKGNNDFYNNKLEFDNNNTYQTISIDNKIWFLTHGHIYNRYNVPVDYNIYLQGHTHNAMMEKIDNKIYLNPGSLGLPRNGIKTYIYYEDNTFYLENLDKEVIEKISI